VESQGRRRSATGRSNFATFTVSSKIDHMPIWAGAI
jgi:hypothetical protein